tara:strand:- start:1 stop:165 length:165 start_codon:yes stop_codon:yes gene_type:complete
VGKEDKSDYYLKKYYLKKGLFLFDIFLIIGIIQYFIFDGSFNKMIIWIKNFIQL